MAKVKIQGHASGTGVITLTAPNTDTDRTITLPDESITLSAGATSLDGLRCVSLMTEYGNLMTWLFVPHIGSR